VKGSQPPAEMSVSSMRSELLELLGWLVPEKHWRKRVAAREVAQFTVEKFPYSAIHRLPHGEISKAFRACHLADVIIDRTKG
jgi:hypothetical protein